MYEKSHVDVYLLGIGLEYLNMHQHQILRNLDNYLGKLSHETVLKTVYTLLIIKCGKHATLRYYNIIILGIQHMINKTVFVETEFMLFDLHALRVIKDLYIDF